MNIHKSFTIVLLIALVIAGAGLVAAHGIRSVFPAEYSMHGNEGGEGDEGNGEHGSGGEGSEGSEGGPGPGEESGATYALDETFDMVRNGVRLVMSWDATANAFTGTVENVTNVTIPAVRVEVHLSNGVELGPTARADLAPGEMRAVELSAAGVTGFDGWTPHAEMGAGDSGGEGSGEHGNGEGSEGGPGPGEESGTTYALDETFDMVRNGVRLIMAWDATAEAFVGVVENVTDATISQVRVEVHLSNGVELGPTPRADLAPGEMRAVELSAAGVTGFDGWTPHAEMGAGDSGGEGSGEHGSGEGSEGSEGGPGPGEESGTTYRLDETFDMVRNGVRLVMSWDATANAFTGTVENVTNATIPAVRVEVHLSNGVELGPTPRADLAPGEMRAVALSAAGVTGFDGWTPHAEMGAGDSGGAEAGGEHGGSGGEGSESAGEGNGEGRGEHGSGREGGGEHGSERGSG